VIVVLELEIESIRVRQETQQRAVVLRVKDSNLFLPIFVGHFEVEAIRLKLMDIEVQRPMTHDLLDSIIENLGASVDKIVVSELKEDTFFAKIIVNANGEVFEIDARPSDAIALAVRAGSPIFAEESVLDKAGVNLDDKDLKQSETSSATIADNIVSEDELVNLSVFNDFIDSLDLEDLGESK
jgi:bifunctional DNase/RNase